MRQVPLLLLFLYVFLINACGQQKNQVAVTIVTHDIDHFWKAYDASAPAFHPAVFQQQYIDKGSAGLKAFNKSRIKGAENLVKVITKRPQYYASLRASTQKISNMNESITRAFQQMKELHPSMKPPTVYFVIGAMNSGGTSSDDGLIIGADMYGLTSATDTSELDSWLKTVLKPVEEIPHIVAHELVHFYQRYDGGTLLAACIKEGGADYIAELISGKHINQPVHAYANPREKELWTEFQKRMLEKDYSGWLYSSSPGRPNDLGYWIGYQITKAFFDKSPDQKQVMEEFLTIKDFEKFLQDSGYAKRFQ